MAQATSDIPKQVRQLNLVMTLLYYPHGLTKNELFACIEGYSDDYSSARPGENLDALERRFSRDKEELKDLGIPIESVMEFDALDDNQVTRYVIREQEYQFPPGVTFSTEELSLIQRASEAWREGSLSRESRHALTKLRSLGYPADDAHVGVSIRLNTSGEAFELIHTAIDDRKAIEFMYLKPNANAPEKRTVVPLALLSRFNQWHVYTFDIVRENYRTFLLSRIVSLPRLLSRSDLDFSGQDFAAIIEAEVDELYAQNVARVKADADSDASVRLRSLYGDPDENGIFLIHFSDIDLLADALTEYGRTIQAREPHNLQAALDSRLSRIADSHAGSTS